MQLSRRQFLVGAGAGSIVLASPLGVSAQVIDCTDIRTVTRLRHPAGLVRRVLRQQRCAPSWESLYGHLAHVRPPRVRRQTMQQAAIELVSRREFRESLGTNGAEIAREQVLRVHRALRQTEPEPLAVMQDIVALGVVPAIRRVPRYRVGLAGSRAHAEGNDNNSTPYYDAPGPMVMSETQIEGTLATAEAGAAMAEAAAILGLGAAYLFEAVTEALTIGSVFGAVAAGFMCGVLALSAISLSALGIYVVYLSVRFPRSPYHPDGSFWFAPDPEPSDGWSADWAYNTSNGTPGISSLTLALDTSNAPGQVMSLTVCDVNGTTCVTDEGVSPDTGIDGGIDGDW